jgi:glucose-1-phosphate thymidylyltransferase
MKVIIPVAGEGTRLRPLTYTTPKALLPVAGKPILGHIIDQITDLDISELIFITGPQGLHIENYVREQYKLKTTCVEQTTLYGLGYAVHLGIVSTDEELLVILGDTVVELDWHGLIAKQRNALVVKEVPDPRAFGVVEVDGDRIVRLIEKPANPPSNLAVVGVYYICDTKRFNECTNEIINKGVTTHGEIQLTDAFDLFLKKGSSLYTFPTQAWYDCGRRETLLETNRFLLEKNSLGSPRQGSTVISPCYLPMDAQLESSTVGPYVSLGRNTIVRNSTIKNSIIFDNTRIESSNISDSLIGNKSLIRNVSGSFNLGDSSELDGGN